MQEIITHKLRMWLERAARHAPSAWRHLAGTLWLTLAVAIVLAAALLTLDCAPQIIFSSFIKRQIFFTWSYETVIVSSA
ncbi:MAG: hypothetical protein C4528_05930, partial [Gammaproteobacteria bacterium]